MIGRWERICRRRRHIEQKVRGSSPTNPLSETARRDLKTQKALTPFSLAVNFKRTTSCRPTALATSWKPRHSHRLVSSVFLPFHSSIPFFHSFLPFPLSPLPKNTTRTGKNQPKMHSMKLKRFLLRYYPPGTCNCHTGTPYVPMRCSFACNPLTTSID